MADLKNIQVMNVNPNVDINLLNAQQKVECSSQIQKQTNERIYNRNIPSQMLQPYIDVRPVMTKYSYLPIVDPRKEVTTRLIQTPTYNVNQVFNPGNTESPWSGFASNVNTESVLRNQVFALQKCSQSVYVPSSNSDLYHVAFHTKPVSYPDSLLFQEEKFCPFNPNPNPKEIGYATFHNATRLQVRNITDPSA
jgi:hypothetical protein